MELEQIAKRFADHELTSVFTSDNFKVFDYRNKDGNNHCYQRWIIDRGTLHVTGDNYAAIYNWNNSSITLEFLAKCDLGYFMSKCLADKDGSTQEVFCEEHTEKFLKNLACDTMFTYGEDELEIDKTQAEWDAMTYDERFALVTKVVCTFEEIDEDEFVDWFEVETQEKALEFLCNPDNEFLFGADAWEYAKCFMIPTMTPKMHLTALREAYKQYPNAF